MLSTSEFMVIMFKVYWYSLRAKLSDPDDVQAWSDEYLSALVIWFIKCSCFDQHALLGVLLVVHLLAENSQRWATIWHSDIV